MIEVALVNWACLVNSLFHEIVFWAKVQALQWLDRRLTPCIAG